ncbi:MAG TPA: DUF1287 domain-containing protein [Candidatus Angelobacter sp.]|nr:DUF1287 domain-containing protein [Candidatus Angelobacter sp.]
MSRYGNKTPAYSDKARWAAIPALVLAIAALLAAQTHRQPSPAESHKEFLRKFVAAAVERTHHVVRYDPKYVRLAYPGGDVPPDTGVCTDEVIRAYRAVGVDLQKEVHEDMVRNFSAYPSRSIWRFQHPDSNIDHRRVPNLMVFFSRKGEVLPISARADDYQPGDLVTWDLGRGVTHIGMVVDQRLPLSRRYMIVHNIGQGPKLEDVLFDWKIIGHYRYFGPENARIPPAPTRSVHN